MAEYDDKLAMLSHFTDATLGQVDSFYSNVVGGKTNTGLWMRIHYRMSRNHEN